MFPHFKGEVQSIDGLLDMVPYQVLLVFEADNDVAASYRIDFEDIVLHAEVVKLTEKAVQDGDDILGTLVLTEILEACDVCE